MPATRPLQPHRIDYIDGLRGLAVSLVVVSHVLERTWVLIPELGTVLNHPILDFLGLGRIGVVAFFCVSGFVIPFSFREPFALRRFLVSRFFRLYPAYWLSLAAFIAVAAIAGQFASSTAQIVANLTMFQAGLGKADLVGVYWTLFYELLFYAACMIAYWAGWLRETRAIIAIVLALSAAACLAALLHDLRIRFAPPIGIPGYLAIMFFGTFWRRVILAHNAIAQAWRKRLVAVVVIMVAFVGIIGYQHGPLPDRPIADLIGVFVGLGVFLLAFRFKGTLANPVMLWLGSISYSLYLFHAICMMAIEIFVLEFSSPVFKLGLLFGAVPLSLLVAHLCAKFVEMPMIYLGHKVGARIAGRRGIRAF